MSLASKNTSEQCCFHTAGSLLHSSPSAGKKPDPKAVKINVTIPSDSSVTGGRRQSPYGWISAGLLTVLPNSSDLSLTSLTLITEHFSMVKRSLVFLSWAHSTSQSSLFPRPISSSLCLIVNLPQIKNTELRIQSLHAWVYYTHTNPWDLFRL